MSKALKESDYDDLKGIGRRVRSRRLTRFFSNSLIKVSCYSIAFALYPTKFMGLIPRESRTGLLSCSIINNPLYAPSQEVGSISQIRSSGGKWVAYDFLRLKYWKRATQTFRGTCYAMIPDEVIGRPSEDYTPTREYDLLSTDLFFFERPSIERLQNVGMLEITTYAEAYQRVAGMNEETSNALHSAGIADQEVFQVTPKGNGLIFVGETGGDPEETKSTVRKLQTILSGVN